MDPTASMPTSMQPSSMVDTRRVRATGGMPAAGDGINATRRPQRMTATGAGDGAGSTPANPADRARSRANALANSYLDMIKAVETVQPKDVDSATIRSLLAPIKEGRSPWTGSVRGERPAIQGRADIDPAAREAAIARMKEKRARAVAQFNRFGAPGDSGNSQAAS